MSSPTFTKTLGTQGIQDKANEGAVLNGSLPKIKQGVIGNLTLEPTEIDISEEAQHIEVTHRPYFHTYDKTFILNDKHLPPGLYYHAYHGKNKQEPYDVWVCSPIYVVAATRDENHMNWGLLLRFTDLDGYWHEWAMPRQLIRGNGDELRGLLLSMGVQISTEGDPLLLQWLRNVKAEKRITAASCTGWYHQDDAWTFVFPHLAIGSNDICFQAEHNTHHDFKSSGTLQGWREYVAAPCQDNPMLLFVMSLAFAGPLLKLVNQSGGSGIHLLGDSSQGKTTALRMAASVWGSATFVKSWRATGNGLEGIAAAMNDTLLVLDEISECDPQEIGSIVYALGNGVGKQRANRYGGAREPSRWRFMWLSSGERSLNAHMQEANLSVKAGQQVRLLDIPATQQTYGIFDNLYGCAHGGAFADLLAQGYQQHYGHAGIAFIQNLINDKQNLQTFYADICHLPLFAAKDGLGNRAAKVFALVAMAGELAIQYGIVHWSSCSAIEAASYVYTLWCNLHGDGQTEEQQILKAVQTFIDRHGESRFYPLRPEHRLPQTVYDRAGYWKENAAGRVYCFFPSVLERVVKGFEKSRIALTLERAGWLIDRDKDKRTKKMTLPDGSKVGLYVVQPQEIDP